MKYFSIAVLVVWATSIGASESNKAMQWCIDNTSNINAAASCHSDYRKQARQLELAELRDFLKHNPRYRVPGQSLNRCWGRPREMPFESVNAGASADGSWYVGVNYKDTIPAGCYENGPWDNRNEKN